MTDKYIVWHNFGSEGWHPSTPIDGLDEVWNYLRTNPYRDQDFEVTMSVDLKLVVSHE